MSDHDASDPPSPSPSSSASTSRKPMATTPGSRDGTSARVIEGLKTLYHEKLSPIGTMEKAVSISYVAAQKWAHTNSKLTQSPNLHNRTQPQSLLSCSRPFTTRRSLTARLSPSPPSSSSDSTPPAKRLSSLTSLDVRIPPRTSVPSLPPTSS